MTIEEIDKIVTERPFKPFRLILNSGEELIVQQPRKALMSGPYVAVVGMSRHDAGSVAKEKFRIIQVEQIVSAEFVAADRA